MEGHQKATFSKSELGVLIPSLHIHFHLIPSLQNDWSTFKKERNGVTYFIKSAKSKYYRHKLNENARDQKTTWKGLNDLQ